jgi:uncharacterized protein (TIGR02145 family)
MKKLLVVVAFIAMSIVSYAQVGIGTTTPEGVLDVVSENSGIILPRVANVSEVTSPVNGMMVYDLLNTCVRAFEAGIWTDCLNGAVASAPPIATGPCQGQPEYFTFNGLTYKPIESNGVCWLDRNLGASQAGAISSTDVASYGDLYQWGRFTDGHEVRTPSPNTEPGPVDVGTEGGNFITNNTFPRDWLSTKDPLRWDSDATQGVTKTDNDPCPTVYRVPTEAELQAEVDGFSNPSNNAAGAFNSVLKLPMAGYRNRSDGYFNSVGSSGSYWSSTVSGAYARYLSIDSSYSGIYTGYRADGFSVRCLKD